MTSAIGQSSLEAHANWLTHIVREAGEAGGKSAGHVSSHLGPVGKAAAHLEGLLAAPKGSLAAHATPEGHWQFVNRQGQVFTAGTPDEMGRVLPTLAPDAVATGQGKLSLYLSEDSVFGNRSALESLPDGADLHVVTDNGAFAVTRTGRGAAQIVSAKIRPNITIDLIDQGLFQETLFVLARPLNKSNIRTIALEPGAPKSLSSAPQLDATSKVPLVDQIDPAALGRSFGSIRGQTALLTGRVEDGRLVVSPSSGPEIKLDLAELSTTAADNNVNLVILHSDATRQAGGRNWLWQKIEVGGLKDATEAATFGDFLEALAARRGGFQLSSSHEGMGRLHISATPDGSGGGITGQAASTIDEVLGHITGEVVTNAVDIHGRDMSSQTEEDARLIPGIPSYVQFPYLAGIVAGLIAWGTSRRWWQRIWPPRAIVVGGGRTRRALQTLPREVAFLLAFLPIAGLPAMLWQAARQTWDTILAPFRWFRRRFLMTKV